MLALWAALGKKGVTPGYVSYLVIIIICLSITIANITVLSATLCLLKSVHAQKRVRLTLV